MDFNYVLENDSVLRANVVESIGNILKLCDSDRLVYNLFMYNLMVAYPIDQGYLYWSIDGEFKRVAPLMGNAVSAYRMKQIIKLLVDGGYIYARKRLNSNRYNPNGRRASYRLNESVLDMLDDNNLHKQCSNCGAIKSVDDFGKCTGGKFGVRRECKLCRKLKRNK